ncbi:hypothetical protein C8R43DRAFT_1007425 [Mycena crocata]|nr:hypothetical protein C8R43DRAFT_1007425 [Mycena crocata]
MAEVPNELWLEIFRNLPRASLRNISLTDRYFSGISRPLLFTTFDFHPYAVSAGSDLPFHTATTKSMERLNSWCSAEIAPLVRSCNISPYRAPTWDVGTPLGGKDYPCILLDAFFANLASFTGLQRIIANSVHFTQIGMHNLCRLPALKYLTVYDCRVTVGEEGVDPPVQRLCLAQFSIRDNVTREGDVRHWLPLFNAQYLRELDVMCNVRFFGDGLNAVPQMPHVHKLSVSLDFATMAYNLGILAKLPSVERFELRGWGKISHETGLHAQASGVFSLLTEYTGPEHALHLFLPRPRLTRLTVSYCSPADLMLELQGMQTPLTGVKSLNLTFDDLDNPTLQTLFEIFPHLTELHIHIAFEVEEDMFDDDVNDKATTFFSTLAATPALPPTLKHIALVWEFEYEDIENAPVPDDGDVPDLAELRDALVERCPSLTSLWLDGRDFLFQWRQLPDGTMDERSVDDAYDAEDLRDGFSMFWTAR